MKRRSRPKPAFSRSGEASAAANRKGKDDGKQQQMRGGAAPSASTVDEIYTSRSVSSRETGRSNPPHTSRWVSFGKKTTVRMGWERRRRPQWYCVNRALCLLDRLSVGSEEEEHQLYMIEDEIVQDEDEYSGKIICGDLGKMVAQDEDGQHSENIGAHAVEDQQGIGRAGEHVQALLDMDDDTIIEKISYYLDQLKFDPPDNCDYLPLPPYEPQKLTEVYEQLALYRIRGYQLSMDRQLAELDDESLKKHYSSTDLYEEGYFQHYEESLEWYFDPELCENPELDDYQRLVLYNHGEYRDWDRYHSTLNTFEKDLAYVQYCEALVNETKWIEDHLEHSKHQWNRVENVAKIQALQIAAGFPDVPPRLVLFAFNEHIWSILFDHSHYTRMDCVYFEIWKRVAKLKMDFREALLELHRENMFPLRALDIEYELEDVPRRFYMKNDYDAYIADIDETASDDNARQHIMEAVVKMIPKPKIYLDYIKEKVDIAEDILLIGKVSRPCQSNIGGSGGQRLGKNIREALISVYLDL